MRVDRLYGGAFSLHFGRMLAASRPRARERGEWVITAWGGDAVLKFGASVIDDRVRSRDDLLELVPVLERALVTGAHVHLDRRSLLIEFTESRTIELLCDRAFDGDSWTVSLPTLETVAMDGGGRLSLSQ